MIISMMVEDEVCFDDLFSECMDVFLCVQMLVEKKICEIGVYVDKWL